MIFPAIKDLTALRDTAFEARITIVGVDYTGLSLARFALFYNPDDAAAILTLTGAGTAAPGEGMSFSVETTNGVPKTTFSVRLNKSTIAAQYPWPGNGLEPGQAMTLNYNFELTKAGVAGGIESRWQQGQLILQPKSGRLSSASCAAANATTLQLSDDNATVLKVDGVDLLIPILASASGFATASGNSALSSEASRQATISLTAQAQLAANAAAAGANLFPSVAAGLAATADQKYFSVPEQGSTYATLYQRNGAAAVAVNKIASASSLQLGRRVDFARIRAQMAQGTATIGLMLGDSTTDGVGTTGWPGNHAAGDAAYSPANAYPAVLQGYLRSLLGNAGITIYNGGFSGQTTQWLLDNYDAIRANMGGVAWTLVSPGLNDEVITGFNALNYSVTLANLVLKIIATGSVPVLMSPDPMMETGVGAKPRRNERVANEIAEVMKGIAAAYGLEYWDNYGAQVAHWRVNRDGTRGQQAAQQPDDLHGADNVHAFKASLIVARSMPGRVYTIPLGGPTFLAAWDAEMNCKPSSDGVFRGANPRPGGNVFYSNFQADATTNLLDALVWNDGAATAFFVRSLSNNGAAAGCRIKVDGLSYSALAVSDTTLLSSGLNQNPQASASENAMFVCVLPHGLSRIRMTGPTTADQVLVPYFEFFPGYPHHRDRGTFKSVGGAPAQVAASKGFFAPPGGGNQPFYAAVPAAVRVDGGNLVSMGPDATKKTRLIVEATMPEGAGFLLLDGQAWPASLSEDDLTTRIALYVSRNNSQSQISVGRIQYRTADPYAQAGALVGQVTGPVIVFTDRMTFLIDLWREADRQRVQVMLRDGTLACDWSALISSGVSVPIGGIVGGLMNGARAAGLNIDVSVAIYLEKMSS